MKQLLNRAEAAHYLQIEPQNLDQFTTYWGMKYRKQSKRKLFTKTELQRFFNLPGYREQLEYDPYCLIRPKKNGMVTELYPGGITGFEQKPLKSNVR